MGDAMAPVKLTAADHAMIHGLTVLATLPWGICTDEAEQDEPFRAILSGVVPRVSRGNAALAPLLAQADRVIATRGGLGALRHHLLAPLNDWNRARLLAAVAVLENRP